MTLAEKQAWMRSRMRRDTARSEVESGQRRQMPPPELRALNEIEIDSRTLLAERLNEILLTKYGLGIPFIRATIELLRVAEQYHIDEPRLEVSGRGRGVRVIRFGIQIEADWDSVRLRSDLDG